jgi:hypothetical protein
MQSPGPGAPSPSWLMVTEWTVKDPRAHVVDAPVPTRCHPNRRGSCLTLESNQALPGLQPGALPRVPMRRTAERRTPPPVVMSSRWGALPADRRDPPGFSDASGAGSRWLDRDLTQGRLPAARWATAGRMDALSERPEPYPGPTHPAQDSNLEPLALEASALPIELTGLVGPPRDQGPFPRGYHPAAKPGVHPGDQGPFPRRGPTTR